MLVRSIWICLILIHFKSYLVTVRTSCQNTYLERERERERERVDGLGSHFMVAVHWL